MKTQTKENLYQAYTYSYPHKSAYRTIEPISLNEIWKNESKSNMFFYAHLPFCEMRCGFCNLFTVAHPKINLQNYINAIKREIEVYTNTIGNFNLSNFAIGGGTPTFLPINQLEQLFSIMKKFGVKTETYFGSIETSPKTLTPDKLSLIEESKIARVSMGIQSWIEEEVKSLGRPQSIATTEQAVKMLTDSNVPEFNLDLIYGAKGQTIQSFLYSVERTIEYQPTEIYLYPLYVRQLTGLGKKADQTVDIRHQIYLVARDFLLMNGYEQKSLRCFRKENNNAYKHAHRPMIDQMIGVGAGARSYTSSLHYSTKYAVSRKQITSIIENYMNTAFGTITHGINLPVEEQKRRFVLKSIIDGGKLNPNLYFQCFNTNVFEEFSILNEWQKEGWLIKENENYRLSSEGYCYEDFIGPMLYSQTIKNKMKQYQWQ